MDNHYTRQEAAERLGISTDTLDRERSQGRISYIQRKPGGKVLISETAILEYIARNTHRAKPQAEICGTYRKRRVRKERVSA